MEDLIEIPGGLLSKSYLGELYNKYIVSPFQDTFGLKKSKEKTVYCDAIVLNYLGQLLILQRSYNASFGPGKWSLPGGHLDPGETIQQGAERELDEETDIIADLEFLQTIEKEDCTIHYFTGNVTDPQLILDNEEHYRFEWIDTSEIPEYDFLLDLGTTLSNLFPNFVEEPIENNEEPNLNLADELDKNYEIVKVEFEKGNVDLDTFLDYTLKYNILKKSEGSRGGHIIGHTKSGKPIYEDHNHPSHQNFTHQDHEDAETAHANIGNTLKRNSSDWKHHWNEGGKHYDSSKNKMVEEPTFKIDKEDKDGFSAVHYSDQPDFEKGGEGSRGGKIVGHDKNGKAIYNSGELVGNNQIPYHRSQSVTYHRDYEFGKTGTETAKVVSVNPHSGHVLLDNGHDLHHIELQKREGRGSKIVKSEITDEEIDELIKGARAQIGEVRTWGKEKWVKHIDGWVHVSDKGKHILERPGGKREVASESHVEHAKKYLENKLPSGSTTEEREKFREENKPEEIDNFSEFKDIVNTSSSLEEAFNKVKNKKDVPNQTAREFRDRFDPDNELTPLQAFTKFYDEVKKVDKPGEWVMGYTKSGKPIHSGFEHPDHKNFTKEDHKDAAELIGQNQTIFQKFNRSSTDPEENDKMIKMGEQKLKHIESSKDEFEWKKNNFGHDLYHNGENTTLGAKKESDKKGVEELYRNSPNYKISNNTKKNVKEGKVDLGIEGISFNYKINNEGFYDIYEDKTETKIPVMSPTYTLSEAKTDAISYIKNDIGLEKFKSLVENFKKPVETEIEKKEKTTDLHREEHNQLVNSRDRSLSRLSETRKKYGSGYGKMEPWKRAALKRDEHEVDKSNKKIDQFKYNHTEVRKALKEVGISASTTQTTAIRGFTNESKGYNLNEGGYNPDLLSLNHISLEKFEEVKSALEKRGFEIISSSPPSKIIAGGSSASIKFEPYHKDEDLKLKKIQKADDDLINALIKAKEVKKPEDKDKEPTEDEQRLGTADPHSDYKLKKHARSASEESLNKTIKGSGDEKLRKIAHKELDRRKKEEHIKDEKEKAAIAAAKKPLKKGEENFFETTAKEFEKILDKAVGDENTPVETKPNEIKTDNHVVSTDKDLEVTAEVGPDKMEKGTYVDNYENRHEGIVGQEYHHTEKIEDDRPANIKLEHNINTTLGNMMKGIYYEDGLNDQQLYSLDLLAENWSIDPLHYISDITKSDLPNQTHTVKIIDQRNNQTLVTADIDSAGKLSNVVL